MRIPGLVALLAVGACYSEYRTPPVAYPTYAQPVAVEGPPGGGMDPGWGQQPVDQTGFAEGTDSYGGGEAPIAAEGAPADPQVEGYAMGGVTDGEIDQTLSQHGEWIDTPEYGRVWRPSATVVGANFTPYETCGSWTYTDYGWTFACDWDWGWLPFHYGQWDWYDNSWCWVPGYVWSPGWVDWRSGGGYVGWRPTRPHRDRIVRDHRDGRGGRVVRDHRDGRGRDHRGRESQWRFVRDADMGKRLTTHTRNVSVAEGLSQTAEVARPSIRTPHTASAASVMKGRFAHRANGSRFDRPTRNPTAQGNRQPSVRQPSHTYQQGHRNPTYRPPARNSSGYQGYRPPARNPSTHTYQPPTRQGYQPPTRNPSTHTYQPPTRRPTQGYQPPSRTYQPPRTYTPPTRTHTPPSRSYSPPSRSYSPPSRTPSRSYSPPSSSGGSRSYSPPSRSSSSSGSRASSGSSSSSSRSSGSSSRSSGGGGRRR